MAADSTDAMRALQTMADTIAELGEAAGDLLDAMSDELRYEVSQNDHVNEHVKRLAKVLGGPYYASYGEYGIGYEREG